MTEPKKTPRQLAEEHWLWIESLLDEQRRMEKRLFIDAFIHGTKHGKDIRTRTHKG